MPRDLTCQALPVSLLLLLGLPRPPAAAAPPLKWLVAVSHTSTNRTATYQPVELPAGWPERGEPAVGKYLVLPALPKADWPGHYQALAAQDGEQLGVAVPTAPGSGWQLVHRVLGSQVSHHLDLHGVRPAGLHARGSVFYVGSAGQVGLVDFAAAQPELLTFHQRPGVTKPYDLFARDGDVLVAIDDEVAPIFADTFRLPASGPPQPVAAWQLPGVINGTYERAALSMRSPADGTLYALAPYSIGDGSGHDLVALSLRGGKAEFPAGLILQNGQGSGVPIVEERVPRDPARRAETTLVAGKEATPWTGLALLPELPGGKGRLALAAGSRGLLLLPLNFTADTRAEQVELGGPCLDLVFQGNLLIALVGDNPVQWGHRGPRSTVVGLRWDGKTLVKRGQFFLTGLYQALVH